MCPPDSPYNTALSSAKVLQQPFKLIHVVVEEVNLNIKVAIKQTSAVVLHLIGDRAVLKYVINVADRIKTMSLIEQQDKNVRRWKSNIEE